MYYFYSQAESTNYIVYFLLQYSDEANCCRIVMHNVPESGRVSFISNHIFSSECFYRLIPQRDVLNIKKRFTDTTQFNQGRCPGKWTKDNFAIIPIILSRPQTCARSNLQNKLAAERETNKHAK